MEFYRVISQVNPTTGDANFDYATVKALLAMGVLEYSHQQVLSGPVTVFYYRKAT